MSAVFLSRVAPVKTKEQKRVSRVAKRENSAVAARRKSGPVSIYVPTK